MLPSKGGTAYERLYHRNQRPDQALRGTGQRFNSGSPCAEGTHLRPSGAQRGGQDHHHEDAPGADRPHIRHSVYLRTAAEGKREARPAPHRQPHRVPGVLSQPDRHRKPADLRPASGTQKSQLYQGGAGAGEPALPGQETLRPILPGHEAAAGHRPGGDARPGAADPGRAHQRPGPHRHRRGAGFHPCAVRGAGQDHPDFQPHPLRDRPAGRRHRDHRPRRPSGGGEPGGAGTEKRESPPFHRVQRTGGRPAAPAGNGRAGCCGGE